MRTLVILCLVAVTCADKLGYNYKPVAHSNSGLSFAPGYSSAGSSLRGISAIGGGSAGGESDARGGGNGIGGLSSLDNAPVGLEKEFYTFTAPEDEVAEAQSTQDFVSSIKRGIRVIFIKGPENNGLENAALALANQAVEQKTAIYVLNKETDIGDFADKLNAINKVNNNKPEVHFVKYRTAEDAANAQKAIQGQYDSLGGTSKSHNADVAPVISFASQAPVRSPAPAHIPDQAYLPSPLSRRI